MTSEESGNDLLSQMTEWSVEEMHEKFDHVVPTLISSLQCKEKKVAALYAVQVLLGKCLLCVPVRDAENTVLKHALPAVKLIFSEALDGVHMTIEDRDVMNQDDLIATITSLLQVCVEMLKCLEQTLQYLIAQDTVNAAVVPSVPKIVASVLVDSFHHCQNSEDNYGNLFQLVNDVVKDLFDKSHEVLLSFIVVLNEKLDFRLLFEDEIQLLTEVLGALVQIGEQMKCLSVKAMADAWKAFIALAQKYSNDLKAYLDVSVPIKFLVGDIVGSISTFSQILHDRTSLTKTLKISSFELKILLKLCESYAGYLTDCYGELLCLLITLNRTAPHFLTWHGMPKAVAEEIESYLSIAADILLSHLIEDTSFVQEYFDGIDRLNTEGEHCGLIGLSCAILKKIVHFDVRKLWLGEESSQNVLSVFFRNIDHWHAILCSDVKISAAMPIGEMPKSLDIYETILIHLSAVAVTSHTSELGFIETLLLESVLQPEFWRALLAVDMWCIISRYGSPELCFQHLILLADMLNSMTWPVYCQPQSIYLQCLIRRLFPLLPLNQRSQIRERYPPSENLVLWSVLHEHLEMTEPQKSKISSQTLDHTEDLIKGHMSATEYNTTLMLLAAVPACTQWDLLAHNVITLWGCVDSLEDNVAVTSYSLLGLLSVLSVVTERFILHINNIHLMQIAENLDFIAQNGSPSMKLWILPLLKAISAKPFESGPTKQKLCTVIGKVFGSLMRDKNHIVCQAALDVFTYCAHFTKHEQIIKCAGSGDSDFQNMVAAFLIKQPISVVGINKDFNHYLGRQSVVCFNHKCIENLKYDIRAEEEEPASKKLKVDELQALNIIEKIQEDTDSLISICHDLSLSEEAKKKVVSVVALLESVL